LDDLEREMKVLSGSRELTFIDTLTGVRAEIAQDLRVQTVNLYGVPASTVSAGVDYTGYIAIDQASSESQIATSYTVQYTGTRYAIEIFADGRWTSGTGSAYLDAMPVHIGEVVPTGTWVVAMASYISEYEAYTGYTGNWP